MIAKLTASFAAGLLFATSIVGAVYFFGPTETTSSQSKTAETEEEEATSEQVDPKETEGSTEDQVKPPSEDEMKQILSSVGYVIHTEEEWKNVLAEAEESKKKEESSKGKEKVIYRTIITVVPGMTSIDVGRALVQANIIDNALKFSNRVEKKGVANRLKLGTYEIDSEMSMDDVISIIFK